MKEPATKVICHYIGKNGPLWLRFVPRHQGRAVSKRQRTLNFPGLRTVHHKVIPGTSSPTRVNNECRLIYITNGMVEFAIYSTMISKLEVFQQILMAVYLVQSSAWRRQMENRSSNTVKHMFMFTWINGNLFTEFILLRTPLFIPSTAWPKKRRLVYYLLVEPYFRIKRKTNNHIIDP